ncbi:MAG: hypothetical protein OXH39_04920 [Candidatus Poribacteria bacterium]|nr:hypothetical protein [Candidatus Poribacteria bacterium]
MKTENPPIGLEELEEAFEFFVSHNPEAFDTDFIDTMRNQIRVNSVPKTRFKYTPLIRAVPNGYFEKKRALRNDK